MLAVKNGHTDLLKELKNARVEVSDSQELLFLAASSGHSIVMEYLLKQSSLDMNARDSEGNTLLHLASGAADLEGAKFLLDGNADLTAVNKKNKSAFALASNSDVALALFKKYTSLSLSLEDKTQILFVSTKRRNEEVLRQMFTDRNWCISHTEETSISQVDEKDGEQHTPLWHASEARNDSIVQ